MATIYLGLGSNMGDRAKNIARAVEELNKNGVSVKKLSTLIETDPIGFADQPKFLNAVLEAETKQTPQELHKTVKTIEKNLGRTKTFLNGPRTIDIDILLFGKETINTPELKIPHPQIFKRDFVFNPLKEIAPQIAKKLKTKGQSPISMEGCPLSTIRGQASTWQGDCP